MIETGVQRCRVCTGDLSTPELQAIVNPQKRKPKPLNKWWYIIPLGLCCMTFSFALLRIASMSPEEKAQMERDAIAREKQEALEKRAKEEAEAKAEAARLHDGETAIFVTPDGKPSFLPTVEARNQFQHLKSVQDIPGLARLAMEGKCFNLASGTEVTIYTISASNKGSAIIQAQVSLPTVSDVPFTTQLIAPAEYLMKPQPKPAKKRKTKIPR